MCGLVGDIEPLRVLLPADESLCHVTLENISMAMSYFYGGTS